MLVYHVKELCVVYKIKEGKRWNTLNEFPFKSIPRKKLLWIGYGCHAIYTLNVFLYMSNPPLNMYKKGRGYKM